MIRRLGVFAAVVVVALVWGRGSEARPAPCASGGPETLTLTPGTVTFDGVVLQRSTNGRYVTDAGQEFDVEQGSVAAVVSASNNGCPEVATRVDLNVVDPFAGPGAARATIMFGGTP